MKFQNEKYFQKPSCVEEEQNISNDIPALYQCQFCHMKFNTFRGLGGHTANQHKGLSQTYQ